MRVVPAVAMDQQCSTGRVVVVVCVLPQTDEWQQLGAQRHGASESGGRWNGEMALTGPCFGAKPQSALGPDGLRMHHEWRGRRAGPWLTSKKFRRRGAGVSLSRDRSD